MSADGATRLRPWLRLVRLPLAPTAPWDAACCGALALSASGLSLAAPGVLGWLSLVLTSLALYGAGMTANDVADLERDRYRAPDRPLPSGQVRRAHAALLAVVLAALALALGGSGGDGREAAALALLLASLYDFALKRFPVLGALAMGGVRFANASLLVWPLAREGLAPWPVLLAPLATGLYAAAVTLWSTLEDEVVPGRAWAARALLVLAFLLAAAVGVWVAGGPTPLADDQPASPTSS